MISSEYRYTVNCSVTRRRYEISGKISE